MVVTILNLQKKKKVILLFCNPSIFFILLAKYPCIATDENNIIL